ncbi:MAG: hypothetical protein K5984_04440, partial [Bacteroidales bacterium]|nr:hypothetical protein [Bacteroidales bacterium]
MRKILTILLVAFALVSCTDRRAKLPSAKILVIHCYNSHYADYEGYHDILDKSFVEFGYNPDFRHLYLNADDEENTCFDPLFYGYEQLRSEGWFPDVILTDDDRTLRSLVRNYNKEFILKWNVPIVAGGLHYMYRAFLGNSMYMDELKILPIPDSVDVNRNIDLAVKYGKSNFVFIQNDASYLENIIRGNILREIKKRDNFVNNVDFHETRFNDPVYRAELSDSVYITLVSTQSPERMYKHALDKSEAEKSIKGLFSSLWAFPYVKFTHNIYSDELVNKSGKPQFTAVRDCFADYSHKYLCGYFSSYESMARDMAGYAVQILNGAKVRDIKVRAHDKAYYMDYAAMKEYGLRFIDCTNDFIIVGAPFSLSHPVLWGLTYMGLFFLISTIVTMVVAGYMKYRMKDKQAMLDKLEESQ